MNLIETAERIQMSAANLFRLAQSRGDPAAILMQARVAKAMLKTFIEVAESRMRAGGEDLNQ